MTDSDSSDMPIPIDLNRLVIPDPCDIGWENMDGDDLQRHCSRCDHTVYNLTAMTPEQAAHLLRTTEGKLCGRIFRPDDGIVGIENLHCSAEPSQSKRQFSIRALLVLMTIAASFCAIVPYVGPKVANALDRWLNPPPPAPAPMVGVWEDGAVMIEGELYIDD